MTLLEPSFWRRNAKPLYIVMIALLVIAPVFGAEVRNTRRWIDLGPFRFQPSEFGKLLLVLCLAAFLADRSKRIARAVDDDDRDRARAPADRARLPPAGLRDGDRLRAPCSRAVLFVAGTRWGHLAAILGGAAVAAAFVLWIGPSIGVDILKPYQRARITGFTNPSQDPSGATYNVTASITAVGAGGPPAAASPARRRRTTTTCPSTRPTSRSPRSPSSAASSARRSCSCSTCS